MKKTILYTYIAVIINVIIAKLMGGDFFDVREIDSAVVACVVSLILCTYYIATKIHYFIFIKGYNFFIVTVLGLCFIAFSGAWGASSVFLIEEVSIKNSMGFTFRIGELLFSYYVVPVLAILVYGIVPILFTGLVFGLIIYDTKTKNYD